MRALLLTLLLAACKGPNQPSLYGDYSYLEYDGEQGGVGRVGVNVPLGAGFRDPDEDAGGRSVARLTGAVLALVEQLEAGAQGAPGPAGDVPAAAAADAAGDGGPEGLDDQAAAEEDDEEEISPETLGKYRDEVSRFTWEDIGKTIVLVLIIGGAVLLGLFAWHQKISPKKGR